MQDKVMKYNCQLIYSGAGITLEAMKDGKWHEVMIYPTSSKEISNFAKFVVEDGEYKGLQ